MLRQKPTRSQEQCLREQAITNDQPGPVLRDFQVRKKQTSNVWKKLNCPRRNGT